MREKIIKIAKDLEQGDINSYSQKCGRRWI